MSLEKGSQDSLKAGTRGYIIPGKDTAHYHLGHRWTGQGPGGPARGAPVVSVAWG